MVVDEAGGGGGAVRPARGPASHGADVAASRAWPR